MKIMKDHRIKSFLRLMAVAAPISLISSCKWIKPHEAKITEMENDDSTQVHDSVPAVQETQQPVSQTKSVEEEVAALNSRIKEIYGTVERVYKRDALPNTDLDAKYCSKAWRQTVKAVSAKQNKTDELCLDCDYWIMGQDYENVKVTNYYLEKIMLDDAKYGSVAAFTLKVHNCGSVTPVRVDLVKENGKWLIDNFTDIKNDIDYRKMMTDYLNN